MNQSRIDATAETLLAAAQRMGADISEDGRVNERIAAALMGYEQGSFKNLRLAGGGPAHYKRPFAGTNCSYRISDLAVWLETAREEALV